ncbi:MAG TPA: DUF4159 domain-containing protein [Alphaproteobacteria bacterium]|nr:DUF4159 domain-containing protein [Alphaproteobacteria bacterium]
MLTFGPVAFAAPWLLLALALLPVIWWLLRVTPPAPRRLAFPPLRLLFGLLPKEETPDRTPIWLLVMRLVAAALVILALAQPLLNPSGAAGSGPLILLVDDGWAAARHWEERRQAMTSALERAEREERPVMLVPTAPRAPGEVEPPTGLLTAAEARSLADALQPRPWPTDRLGALARLEEAELPPGASVLWVSDGLDQGGASAVADRLSAYGAVTVLAEDPVELPRILLPPEPGVGPIALKIARPAPGPELVLRLRVSGEDGTLIAEAEGRFSAGARETEIVLDLPLELRNRIARVSMENEVGASAVALLDESWRRRPVGLFSGSAAERAQPLLGGLYYVERALEPHAELRRGSIEELLRRELAVMVLDDVGALTEGEISSIGQWVERGGVLLRFAGPHLAENAQNDTLLPVRLRAGDRILGGTLSWEQPARLAPFSQESPFGRLPIPPDVTVSRQVLAEPTIDLGGKTWARLADGTPLVTAAKRGDGWIVLVHTTANADWSNLALSGLFVDMLRRLVEMSAGVASEAAQGMLAPLETLDGYGRLGPAAATAVPIAAAEFGPRAIGPRHPPGYYGADGARRALNLGPHVRGSTAMAKLPPRVTVSGYGRPAERALMPWLLTAALALLWIDMLVSLGLRGYLTFGRARAAAMLLPLLLGSTIVEAQEPVAEGPDGFALAATTTTKLAFVRSGNPELDQLSEAGLYGLSLTLNRRTAAEQLSPLGVDLEADELSFFPLLYWPVDPAQPALSQRAIRKLNDYVKNGGMVLFDTRDQASGGQGLQRLRELARGLDIPPLVPVPPDHVLTKAFYLIQDFPGRFAGGQLWVEVNEGRVNDGVSSVILGGNDWAGAWATDDAGRPMNAVVPGGEQQREAAYRFGINLVMYALTGNYKADQVHVPAILERLGQ